MLGIKSQSLTKINKVMPVNFYITKYDPNIVYM
jgi:hypothetical protein